MSQRAEIMPDLAPAATDVCQKAYDLLNGLQPDTPQAAELRTAVTRLVLKLGLIPEWSS